MGEEPDPERMPISLSNLPEQVQTAFFILGFLPDVWEGMSGMYLGKDWSSLEYLLNLYEVEEPKVVIMFMKMYETITINERAAKQKAEQKKAERKNSAGSGKKYTHNIKG